MGSGPAFYVDAVKGNDVANGSAAAPWKTVATAIAKLKAGDTLYLRGGTYYESLEIRAAGEKDKPITIRGYPGEMAIIDAGLREFYEDPAHAWEPVPGGGPDEYQSVKAYENGGSFARFGDSMLPMQRYLTLEDLRSTDELFRPELENRSQDKTGIYCGPGVRRDAETGKPGRIHIRLSHTKLEGLGDAAYTGETDPRKLPLVISGGENAIAIQVGKNLRLQDLVLRGGRTTALRMEKAANIECDGLTLYSGSFALTVSETSGLKMTNSALHGFSAPWLSRFAEKDRSKSGYIAALGGENFEISNCEFTDHHDGLQLFKVQGLSFHHNFVENFNDDGIEPGVKQAHGKWTLYCNYFGRILSPFTAHGKNQTPVNGDADSGMWVFRNVIDLRGGTYYNAPAKPDPTGAFVNKMTEAVLHDHGSPLQPSYYVYQNTIVLPTGAWRGVYASSWGARTVGTTRRVFNNICYQIDGPLAAVVVVKPEDDFQADGNLHWSLRGPPTTKENLFAKFRGSPLFAASKSKYPAGWASNDVVADPQFVSIEGAPTPDDLRLKPASAAIDAGQPLPAEWPDPLREADKGAPDIGAIPLGAEAWTIGVDGRYSAFGKLRP